MLSRDSSSSKHIYEKETGYRNSVNDIPCTW